MKNENMLAPESNEVLPEIEGINALNEKQKTEKDLANLADFIGKNAFFLYKAQGNEIRFETDNDFFALDVESVKSIDKETKAEESRDAEKELKSLADSLGLSQHFVVRSNGDEISFESEKKILVLKISKIESGMPNGNV
jgi:hypothetical protein